MSHTKRYLQTISTVLLDGIVITLSFLTSYYLRAHLPIFEQTKETPLYPYLDLMPFVIIISLFSLQFCGVYKKSGQTTIDQIPNLFIGSCLSTILLILITFIFKMYPYSRIVLILFWILAFLYLIIWRGIVLNFRKQWRKKGIGLTKAIIIGSGETGQMLARELNQSEKTGYQIVGFLEDSPQMVKSFQTHMPILGSSIDLPKIIEKGLAEEVFISSPHVSPQLLTEFTVLCAEYGIRLNIMPELNEIIAQRATLTDLNGIPLIIIEEQIFHVWNRFIKRVMDCVLAGISIIFSLPITIPIAFWIRLDPKSPGPIFFKQERVGRRGKIIMMYKFRSMKVGAEEQVAALADLNIAKGLLFKIPNDPRVTAIGKFIRRWSLDELPQLINVLKNEMSLVGPRPPLSTEFDKYEEWQKKRLEIQPGMTGLWQVSGRSELPFDEMVKLDLYYIEHWSLWLDLKILLRTLVTVILGKGAY